MTDAQVMFLRFAYVLVVVFMFVTCDINPVLMMILFFVTLYQLHFAQQHGLPLEVHPPFSLDFPFPRAAKPTQFKQRIYHTSHVTRSAQPPTSSPRHSL